MVKNAFGLSCLLFLSACVSGPIDTYVSEDMPACKVEGTLDAVEFFRELFGKEIFRVIMVPDNDRAFNGYYAPGHSITIRAGEIKEDWAGKTNDKWIPGKRINARITLQTLEGCYSEEGEALIVGHELLHTFGFHDEYEDEWKGFLMYGKTFRHAGWKLTESQFKHIDDLI